MEYNFKVLFTQFNPTVDQMKAMFQDLWRKNDENQSEISRLRGENEAKQSKISSLELENDEKSHKIAGMEREKSKLMSEIELLKMIAVNEEPSCPVCLEKFDGNDRQPYLLSCPHMVCAQCLSQGLSRHSVTFIRAYNESARRRGPELMSEPTVGPTYLNIGDYISDQRHPSKLCPVCRTPVTTELRRICLHS